MATDFELVKETVNTVFILLSYIKKYFIDPCILELIMYSCYRK